MPRSELRENGRNHEAAGNPGRWPELREGRGRALNAPTVNLAVEDTPSGKAKTPHELEHPPGRTCRRSYVEHCSATNPAQLSRGQHAGSEARLQARAPVLPAC